MVLAPYNYLDRLPKALCVWLDEQLETTHSWGPLPGRFTLTSIRLHVYYFTRLGDPYELVEAELETNEPKKLKQNTGDINYASQLF